MFAAGSVILWKKSKGWKNFVKVCLLLQLTRYLFAANDEIVYHGRPTVKQFYATTQFNEIANYIGKPKNSYRVASTGIHPAITQYNGFYTLDTYNNFYPLSYKHEFRKIIAKELDKSPTLKSYYDQWGGRVYLFVAQLEKHYEFKKNSKVKIKDLQLNTRVFKSMEADISFQLFQFSMLQKIDWYLKSHLAKPILPGKYTFTK